MPKHLFKLLYFEFGLFLIDFNVIGFLDVYIEDLLVYILMLNVLNVILLDLFLDHDLYDFDEVLSDVVYEVLGFRTVLLKFDFQSAYFLWVYSYDILQRIECYVLL